MLGVKIDVAAAPRGGRRHSETSRHLTSATGGRRYRLAIEVA